MKKHFEGNNLNDIYLEIIKQITTDPEYNVAPRGMNIKEITNVTITLTNPRNSLITFKQRKLNYAFAAIEKLEYLSGQNNPSRIIFYNKNFGSFINKYGFFDGAYAERFHYWRRYIYELIKSDPDTRQAVIPIYSIQDRHETKDIPCLAGDTIMNSPEGNITIKELSERFESGLNEYPLYTFNEKTRDIEIKQCKKVWKSGNKKLLKITFNDGSILKCTPNHKLYQKLKAKQPGDKKYQSSTSAVIKEAKDFIIGERLWATKFFLNGKGRPVYIKNLSENWHYKNQVGVHKEYATFLYGSTIGKEIHHIDDDILNNKKENLKVVSFKEHRQIHMNGHANPMRNETSENNLKRRLKLRETWIKKGYNVKPEEEYVTNHKIVNIEEIESADVYDFTCEDNHNAVVGTGIVVHNCTLFHHFFVRNNKLHMTVYMRSNDILWGLPYDINGFCFIQEAMAGILNYEIGSYTHIVGSLHSYNEREQQLIDLLKFENQERIDIKNPQLFNNEHLTFEELMNQLNLFWFAEEKCRKQFDTTIEENQLIFGLKEYFKIIKEYVVKKNAANTKDNNRLGLTK